MNCEKLVSQLWDYFEGKLSEQRHAECDAHARQCPTCGPLLEKCRELTCRQFTELLDDYVDGRLSADRCAVMDRHLSVCPDCVHYLDGYRKTRTLSQAVAEDGLEQVPPDLVRAVIDAWSKLDR